MLPDASIITQRLNYVQFGYYTPEEIRKMSVKEITNFKAFDNLNHAIKGGLYDPAMGVQPHERGTRCITCGQENMDCPGHIGHIELLLPVYNPYLVSSLVSLLRAKCFFCHKLRITNDRKQYYKNKFKLLRLGRLVELKQYEQMHLQKVKMTRNAQRKPSQSATDTSRKGSDPMQCEDPMIEMKSQIKQVLSIMKVKENPEEYSKGVVITAHHNYEMKLLMRSFFKDINKKCPHCSKVAQTIRKEGSSKFFIIDKSEVLDEKQQKKNKNQYLNPLEISEQIRMLWQWDSDLLKYVYGSIYIDEHTIEHSKNGYDLRSIESQNFFIEVLTVTANRFRPENKVHEQTFLHGHTITYARILELNQELRVMITNLNSQPNQDILKQDSAELKKIIKLESVFQKWLELQDCVIGLFNSEKAQNKANRETPGVKQLLERKQGLFRMKMMGKRVNFACRSVISPDPQLSTNEVGVPLVLAKKLIIPENVNNLNQAYLKELIMNGPQQYPGALFFQEDGKKISLEFLTAQQRLGIIRELGSGDNKVVWRQLRTGDVMLFNRQPSLHKPSIMGHIVRVLPNEQTIRFHYANCKSYNADFDGDEMNLHFVQNYLARSEGYNIALNDHQYISNTNGKPLRELMQDMIISSVFLTLRDTFLTKSVFQQLLYVSVQHLFSNNTKRIPIPQPAIFMPTILWTGKQLITALIKIIVEINGFNSDVGLNLDAKAKVSKSELPGMAADDTQVIFRDNELLLGIIDKNSVGSAADYGLVHAFHELYGPTMTGQLLTGMARLFAAHLQMHGFTCGLDDLVVSQSVDDTRKQLIKENLITGMGVAAHYAGYEGTIPEELDLFNRPTFQLDDKGHMNVEPVQNVHFLSSKHKLIKSLEKKILSDKNAEEQLDSEYRKAMSVNTSKIVSSTLPGLKKLFPQNLFSCMTVTGAKGSNVNHSQVSVLLGQQELEGRRVPLMPSGRSLPSFQPYDPNPRAGGYVADRFLTGLRPQEFFFHCMAGREGLIDTAVKTSRSGYLQRCLVKHLEGLIVQYDLSVRDTDGSLIQMFYGEDGVDTSKAKYLQKYSFLIQNSAHYGTLYRANEFTKKFDTETVKGKVPVDDTLMNIYNPTKYLGSVPTLIQQSLEQYMQQNTNEVKQRSNADTITTLSNIRYLRSMVHPGEAVGCIAGQSIGEPSTQMTLNTFHLAGHGEKNVTLGIPRLREILMTATKNQKTPTMTLQFKEKVIDKVQAERYARRISKLLLIELVSKVSVTEYKKLHENGISISPHQRGVIYDIDIVLEDLQTIQYIFGLSETALKEKILKLFLPLFSKIIQSELSKNSTRSMEKTQMLLKQKEPEKKRKNSEDDDDAEDDEDGEDSLLKELGDISINMTTDYDNIFDDSNKKEQTPAKKQQQQAQQPTHKYIQDVKINGQNVSITVRLPLNTKKILMTNLVRKTLSNTTLQEIKGIQKAKVIKNDKEGGCPFQIYTDGVNLRAVKHLDFINYNSLDCNDIVAIMNTFGIEAARNSIIKEVLAVFGAYGVSVDYRHLYLIADYMTFGGQIRAMNRIWMDYNTSPLGKMSFETSTQFLTNACMNRETDYLTNLSSQLVLGRVPKVGTAMCDILYQMEDDEQ